MENSRDDFAEFISNLSENAKTSLLYADSISRGYGSPKIGTEHLLMGILAQGPSAGARILSTSGITLDRAEQQLGLKPTTNPSPGGIGVLSETVKISLRNALKMSKETGSEKLGTEHILHSILSHKSSKASTLLLRLGVDVDFIIRTIEEYMRQNAPFSPGARFEHMQSRHEKMRENILHKFGEDLVEKAKNDEFDPVIGREKEIDRVVLVLSRRRKNNPLLIGDPGIGKTSIVEGLALRIAEGNVPDYLQNNRIIQLDIASIIAGTKYRGEFEDRMRAIIKAITDSKNTIVFMDEIHLLVGAGSAEGAMDAANLLKPALARGKMKLIGATTFDEHKKYIEKDAALERRFQNIIVKEPSKNDTMAILRGIRPRFEKFHNVKIDDDVLQNIVFMSDRYIKYKYMPDKAIDVLDESAAQVRANSARQTKKQLKLRNEIKSLKEEIASYVEKEEYKKAADKKPELTKLQNELKKESDGGSKRGRKPVVTAENVARAVSQITGIAVEKLQKDDRKQLLNLEKFLSNKIIGQEDAVKKVARAIRRGRSGISSENRPIGSFVFMGPTGVGKTEFARVLAEEIFGRKDTLIKIDMSEFSERHTASRLVGAPAGYIGHEDGGQLTEKIRKQPYSVVLFDEIEKADESIFNLLLQILEDGKLTDGKGRTVDFSNALVILTSNLGSESMNKEVELGFAASNKASKKQLESLHEKNVKAAKNALLDFMSPELLNRFDDIIYFKALSKDEILKIVDNILSDLAKRLQGKLIGLKVTSAVKKYIVKEGYDEKNGARPLRRLIENKIEHKIAEGLLAGDFCPGDNLTVKIRSEEIFIDKEK